MKALFALLAASLLLVTTGPSFATDRTPLPVSGFSLRAAWADCAQDRRRLCSHVVPGGGRIVRCLMDKVESAAPQCRRHIDKVLAADDAWNACQPDIARHCSGVLPGGGRVVSCLSGNKDRLSRACLKGLADAEETLRY